MQKPLPTHPWAVGRRSLQTCWKSVFCCRSTKYHWQTDVDFHDPAKRHSLPQGSKRKLDPVLPAAHNACDGSANTKAGTCQILRQGAVCACTCQCHKTKVQRRAGRSADCQQRSSQADISLNLAYALADEPHLQLYLPARHSGHRVEERTALYRRCNVLLFGWGREEQSMSTAQCVVRNAKVSHYETVRNVSHGLRRRPKRAKWANLLLH